MDPTLRCITVNKDHNTQHSGARFKEPATHRPDPTNGVRVRKVGVPDRPRAINRLQESPCWLMHLFATTCFPRSYAGIDTNGSNTSGHWLCSHGPTRPLTSLGPVVVAPAFLRFPFGKRPFFRPFHNRYIQVTKPIGAALNTSLFGGRVFVCANCTHGLFIHVTVDVDVAFGRGRGGRGRVVMSRLRGKRTVAQSTALTWTCYCGDTCLSDKANVCLNKSNDLDREGRQRYRKFFSVRGAPRHPAALLTHSAQSYRGPFPHVDFSCWRRGTAQFTVWFSGVTYEWSDRGTTELSPVDM